MSKCLHPIHLKNGNIVPCGRCYQCRSRIRSSWAFRIQQQFDASKQIWFATLTYNDENLGSTLTPYYVDVKGNILQPLNHLSENLYYVKYHDNSIHSVRPDKLQDWQLPFTIQISDIEKYTLKKYVPSVQKEHVKLFLDKFQHTLKRKYRTQLKYFVAAEYGDEYKRPHYHAIFMLNNYLPTFPKLLEESWNRGFIQCEPPESDSAVTYCLKYLLKGSDAPDGSLRCFSLKSKGLGSDFLNDSSNVNYLKYHLLESDSLSASVSFRSSGRSVPCPRYYSDKVVNMFADDTQKSLRSIRKRSLSSKADIEDYKQKFQTYYERFLRSRPLGASTMVINGYRVNMSDYEEFEIQYDGAETLAYIDNADKTRSTIRETDQQ